TMSDLLVASGVNLGQIEIISFGEENPLEVGSEESFWAQNRRVELTYPQ
ncbi:MAG: peptidoglycan-associated lipoprotein, partial [Thiotrichales bacterium]|nr:peptidoglycan-associated lipoprotein [Thiotrichales bacterium]